MNKTIVRLLLFVLVSTWGSLALAQERKAITGIVRDSTGASLPGISFAVKGTTTAGTTDANGNFRVSVTGTNPVLIFTSIGFNTQEVTVGNDDNIVVVMQANAAELNEVVVTGFGVKQQTRKLAYAVQEVKGDELVRANTANVVNALQGKVAGVMINQGSGGPTSSSRIRIRGNTSLSGNTQPLFVIDGVLIEPGVTGADSWGGASDFGNDIKNLNPDDYETLTVLKGSAASALYGSKAQNGVILITTKKGARRKGLGVTFSHTETFDKAYRVMDVQNVFGAGIVDTFAIDQNTGQKIIDPTNYVFSYGPKFDGQMVRDLDGTMVPWTAKNDLLEPYQTGRFTNTNVAVEGGNERTTFRFSYTNTQSNSVVPNNKLSRNNFNIRATQKLSDIFNLDASINYVTTKGRNPLRQGGNENPVFGLVYGLPRSYDAAKYGSRYIDTARGGRRQDATNYYGESSLWWNLYMQNREQREQNLRANIDLTANVLPWLNFLVRGNLNNSNLVNEEKLPGQGVNYSGGDYSIFTRESRSMRLQALATATKSFGDFEGSLTAGGETFRDLGGRSVGVRTDGGLKIPLQYIIANSVNAPVVNTDRTVNLPRFRTDAMYLYGDVTWKNMLTLNFSARNDWNSSLTYPRTGGGDYSFFYPSVGLSWVFSELLIDNARFDALSFGKLRASYGHTGAATNPFYTSRGYYSLIGNYRSAADGDIPYYGYNENLLPNPDVKNELTKEIELGADIRFFQNRLGLDFTWYKKNTYNQFLSFSTPSESGVSNRLFNGGNIQNQGIEILLSATPIRNKNFEWTTLVNFTRNRNKIVSLIEGVNYYELSLAFGADVKSVARAGRDYGTIISPYSYSTYQAVDATGKPIDHPNNGEKMILTNGAYRRSGDAGQGEKELGSAMEKWLGSNIHTFRYKNFTLGFQVDAKIGGMMASATHQYGSTYGSFESTLFGRNAEYGGLNRNVYQAGGTGVVTATFDDGIVPEGVFPNNTSFVSPKNGQTYDLSGMSFKEAYDQGIIEPVSARLYYARLTQWSTGIREYSVFENSWVAVREVSLGYNLPKKWAEKIHTNSLRVNLVARNLGYLYSTTKDGVNPESLMSNRPGEFAEYGGLPYIRSYGVTVNAGF
ncbi:MAG: SusC/RagA family TonB-linked outer membrane protein [Chitinophagaceae bacterium]|nr:MAG: SusC/RagA family TonB-linked outer membrane protein [Chitinophagaceae bacterium]